MNKIKRVFGVLLILAGILFYAYPSIQQWRMDYQTEQIIKEFEEKYHTDDAEVSDGLEYSSGETSQDAEDLEVSETTELEASESEEIPESESTQSAYLDALFAEMEAYNEDLAENGQQLVDAWSYEQTPVDISGLSDGAIGYIEIPDMNLTIALYIGASTSNMAKGATVLSETSMPIGGENTNCVIAGHRGYSGMPYFKEIEKLTPGSFVYITNPWGTLTYTVTDIQIIQPDDVESILIQDGRDMVTLLTCHPYMGHGQYRYVVYCERVTDEPGAADGIAAGEDSSVVEDGDGAVDEAEDETENENETAAPVQTVPGSELLSVQIRSDTIVIELEKWIRICIPVLIVLYLLYCVIRYFYEKKKSRRRKH